MINASEKVESDPQAPSALDIGAALAMLSIGFDESDVVSVLGYMPDLTIDPDDLLRSSAL